jgi:carboxymethylenebutenolidase
MPQSATADACEISGPEGTIDGVLCAPSAGGPHPGLLYLTDIGGLRPSQTARATRLAALGYVVYVPNVFYRSRRPPMFEFPRDMKDERARVRRAELTGPLTPAAMAEDAGIYVDWLGTRARPGGLAVVGHCFTGGFALRVAAARPDRIVAAASFHGGGLATEAETSPHRLLPQIRARLYFGHAVDDPSMPESAIARLDAALAAWGGAYRSETYAGAHHGWTADDGASFNPEQAERAFDALTMLLRETLGALPPPSS